MLTPAHSSPFFSPPCSRPLTSCQFPDPAHLFPNSGSEVLLPSCLTLDKTLSPLCTCFLSNKMGWLSPTEGQEEGQPLTLYLAWTATVFHFTKAIACRWSPFVPATLMLRTRTACSLLFCLPAGHFRGTLWEQCSSREPEGPGALQPLVPDGHDCGWRGSAGLTLQSEMTRH